MEVTDSDDMCSSSSSTAASSNDSSAGTSPASSPPRRPQVPTLSLGGAGWPGGDAPPTARPGAARPPAAPAAEVSLLSPAFTLGGTEAGDLEASCTARLGVAPARLRFFQLVEARDLRQLQGCTRIVVEVAESSEWLGRGAQGGRGVTGSSPRGCRVAAAQRRAALLTSTHLPRRLHPASARGDGSGERCHEAASRREQHGSGGPAAAASRAGAPGVCPEVGGTRCPGGLRRRDDRKPARPPATLRFQLTEAIAGCPSFLSWLQAAPAVVRGAAAEGEGGAGRALPRVCLPAQGAHARTGRPLLATHQGQPGDARRSGGRAGPGERLRAGAGGSAVYLGVPGPMRVPLLGRRI